MRPTERSLLDRLPTAVLALANGRVAWANEAAAALAGRPRRELEGLTEEALGLPRDCAARLVDGGVAFMLAAHAGARPVIAHAKGPSNGELLVVLEPAPEALPARSLPDDRTAGALERLFELGRAVAGELDLPRVLRLAARTASALVDAQEVFILMPGAQGESQHLALRACLHDAGEPTPEAHRLEERARRLAIAALRQRGPLAESSAGPEDAGHLAAAPLIAGERPVGCIVAARTSMCPRALFEAGDVQRLAAVADYVALAVQSAELFAEQQRRVRELVLLNEVASDCAELGLDRLLPAVTQRICLALGVDLAALLFLDRERDELVTGAVSSARGPVSGARGRAQVTAGLCLKALASRQPRRGSIADLGLPEMRALGAERGLQFAAAVPLLVKDRAMGVVTVARGGRQLNDDEQRLLSAICSEIAVAVENARLFTETQRRAADLELVVSMGEVVARSLDPRHILHEAANRLCEVLECDAVRVYVRHGDHLRSAVERGIPGEYASAAERLPPEDPVIAIGLSSKSPRDVVSADLPGPSRRYLRDVGLARLAVAPLPSAYSAGDESHAGVLVLGRRAPRPFAEPELKVLGAVASQLAVALQNARLFDETRKRMEDLAIVAEAGRALVGAAPLDVALDTVAERLARIAGVRDCIIMLVDANERELYAAGASALVRPLSENMRYSLDRMSLAGSALRERRPQLAPDANSDPRVIVDWVRRFGEQSVFALPLLAGAQALGVVLLGAAERRELSDDEIERAMAIGNQVASAIERARLNGALERSLVELAQAQAQLVRRERLAALGELAALVAHEVRNPLGVIFNSLGSLAKLVTLEGDARRVYDIIREESVRLDRIVGDMLDYTRPTVPHLRTSSLGRVLHDALASADATERNRGTPVDRVRVSLRVDPALPPVPMDERLVHQAIVNVLSNAYQSLTAGGQVDVDAAVHSDGDRSWARIRVRDDGPGIPEEARARLFEPFFTTKATGSGLGLAVVKRILEAHRGEVGVVTAPGEGTTFILDLPLDQPVAPPPGG